jgi:hypothetical protein
VLQSLYSRRHDDTAADTDGTIIAYLLPEYATVRVGREGSVWHTPAGATTPSAITPTTAFAA